MQTNVPLCLRSRPQWKLHSSFRIQLPLTLILYSAPHRQHILLNAGNTLECQLRVKWLHHIQYTNVERESELWGHVVTHGLRWPFSLGGCIWWFCRQPQGLFSGIRAPGAAPPSSGTASASCTVWLLQWDRATSKTNVVFVQWIKPTLKMWRKQI